MKWPVEQKILLGFVAAWLIIIAIGAISYQNSLQFSQASRIRQTTTALEVVFSAVKDAEDRAAWLRDYWGR